MTASLPASFEAIYDSHYDAAWRCLVALGVPVAEADDAAQEVFMIVLKKLPTLRPDANPRPWVLGIARRVALNTRRAGRRREARHLRLANHSKGGDVGAGDASAAAETVNLVERFLDTLTEARREVFVLAAIEGLPPREVAEIVDAKVNTVHSRLHEARRDFTAWVETQEASTAGARGHA